MIRKLALFTLLVLGLSIGAAQSQTLDRQQFLPLIIDETFPTVQIRTEPFAMFAELRLIDLVAIGNGRLLIAEQPGLIHLLDADGNQAAEPFLDLTDRVQTNGGEEGMLDIVLHPNYEKNGYFFVSYTGQSDAPRPPFILSRFERDATDPNKGNPDSELILLEIEQEAVRHKGGSLAFDANGYLYVAVGDDDDFNTAPDMGSLKGKVLRLDIDSAEPYTIPADNPFVDVAGTRDEIWASGLRNPWRIWIDPLENELYIADVGDPNQEEVSHESLADGGGYNYGWPCFEGNLLVNPDLCDDTIDYRMPAHAYSHIEGRCAVIGGPVYRGSLFPEWQGRYVFADFCSMELFTMWRNENGRWQSEWVGRVSVPVTGIEVDEDGELYLTTVRTGFVYRVFPR